MSALLICALFVVLAPATYLFAAWRIERERADHAKCTAHIAAYTGNRMLALTLRELADHYDSVEGQAELTRIRNVVYVQDGPSVPALWMLDKAEVMERLL